GGMIYFMHDNQAQQSSAQGSASGNTPSYPPFFEQGKTYAIIFKDKTKQDSVESRLAAYTAGGAVIGAVVGSIIPVAGTTAGFVVGGLVGSAAGALTAGIESLYAYIIDKDAPQGIVISRYPQENYANCIILDEQNKAQK
ncbi:MAG: hypothetical protein QW594_02525, partial [Candidatus Woesearchaeota archaeon]